MLYVSYWECTEHLEQSLTGAGYPQGTWNRHRRLGQTSCGVHGDRRLQAVLRIDLTMGRGRLCQFSGYGWNIGEEYLQRSRRFLFGFPPLRIGWPNSLMSLASYPQRA